MRGRPIPCPDGYRSWGQFYYAQLSLGENVQSLTRHGYNATDVIHTARRHAEKYHLPMLPVLERRRPKKETA